MIEWNETSRSSVCLKWGSVLNRSTGWCNVSTVLLGLKFNGELLPYFHRIRVIRQGSPLSLYLFILVANVLSHLMKKAEEDGSIKGVKLNSSFPTLSHLLFADDSIFFLDGKIIEYQSVATILNQYRYDSSHVIDLNKLEMNFSRNCP